MRLFSTRNLKVPDAGSKQRQQHMHWQGTHSRLHSSQHTDKLPKFEAYTGGLALNGLLLHGDQPSAKMLICAVFRQTSTDDATQLISLASSTVCDAALGA